jgi:hypothetical protein
MMELAGDLAWPLIPAVSFWLLLHEPTICLVWTVTGICGRWHRRRARRKPDAACKAQAGCGVQGASRITTLTTDMRGRSSTGSALFMSTDYDYQ